MREKLSLILRFCCIVGSSLFCLWAWSFIYFYMKISVIDPAAALESTIVFGTGLFLWVIGLSIIAVVLFYELLLRYIDQKERAYRFRQTLSQVLSHRFGNFLLTQKINLSILQDRFSQEVLNRARYSLMEMESQFREIIKIIEEFHTENLERKVISLRDVVLAALKDYAKTESMGRVRLRLQKSQTFANLEEAKIFVQLFLDNALRYSRKIVYIRTGTFRRRPYLVIVNDVPKDLSSRGVGIGLMIARNIATSLNVSFSTVSRKDLYFTVTLWPRKRWFE